MARIMKKTELVVCRLVLMGGAAWAVAYTQMSTNEPSNLRGTLLHASQERGIVLTAGKPLFFLP